MRAYFLRRLLLIPPTLIGITLIVFFITRLAPGGPLEQALMQAQQVSLNHGSGRAAGQGTALSTDQIDQLKHYYGFDRPWHVAYVQWLGKVAQGDLGMSFRYNEPVWDLICERFPISIFYGLTTLVITYTICVPLGILKAIKHRTWVDTGSSVLIFAGYAIPGYVLGALLLVFFAARLRWFPMGGFTGDNFADLSFMAKAGDLIHHAILPLCCYLIGAFAFTTLLMKNQLMDALATDYMRTAVAKGVSYRRAVLGHALRNSIIPLATDFGQNLTLFLSGSFLIENIFDINGFGLLGYTSTLDRDYPVVMGILLLSSLLLLVGNLISDVLVALADPRIRFG
ncbi:MAG TPA: ABC transporter permease subunit [Rariglobus sp.]|jgi:microcin C transport system permease protein|nr:ABC transporter permease subunit [Rariglobus sp.]